METVHFFLEGPGRETIAVTPVDEGEWHESQRTNDVRRAMIDEEGNIAEQTDKNGYRYQFRGRYGVWSLVVSD
ncbi:hypothetical protein [Stenotrophomonas sp. SY1]|jgi:hypothetical protein|uniref:hypothetical protein n=1 Tax=Stenotrophomonas sp. SY1 TaxID=477235 RepID=UPI001E539F05|nr:hypothetical protein [Stenotrophomonas sp. SY1]MCD9088261.1 hypothetical protein [Stenotrophomonas sp. SY1]